MALRLERMQLKHDLLSPAKDDEFNSRPTKSPHMHNVMDDLVRQKFGGSSTVVFSSLDASSAVANGYLNSKSNVSQDDSSMFMMHNPRAARSEKKAPTSPLDELVQHSHFHHFLPTYAGR